MPRIVSPLEFFLGEKLSSKTKYREGKNLLVKREIASGPSRYRRWRRIVCIFAIILVTHEDHGNANLVFHLGPGTPAMAPGSHLVKW
jgi:hypothetical protein